MSGRRSFALSFCFVAFATIRIVSTYAVFSATVDEPGHFACGLEYLDKHIYEYLPEQPPLARVAAALPPYLAGIRGLGEKNYNVEGREVILRSPHPGRTVALMRLGTLPFFWLACAVVYFWARYAFGGNVAVLAVGVFTLTPPVLAHAGLACTDMALAACVGAAYFALLFWADSPTWARSILLGATTALAVLAKFTSLLYLPAAAALTFLCFLAMERPRPRRLLGSFGNFARPLAIAVAVAATVIWAGYLFSFGTISAWQIKLPAPELFKGLLQAQTHNRGGHPSYLMGQFSLKGWWYYFPVALAVKTPVAILILAGLGAYGCCRKFAVPACRALLAFALGILLPAMISHVDIGIRHVLPLYIALAIFAALALDGLLRAGYRRAGRPVAGILAAWLAIVGVVCHPDYLSYFNEFAGRDPSKILVDSNLDWAQDTKRLGRRLREVGAQKVSILLLEPLYLPLPTEDAMRRLYGIPPVKLVNVFTPDEGWNAVSPTVARTLGISFQPWWDRIPPTEKVGALWVYHIPPASRNPVPQR